MKSLIKLFSNFLLIEILFAVVFLGCDLNAAKKKNKDGIGGKAVLTELRVGEYTLTAAELLKAASEEGFTKVFESNVNNVKIEANTETGAVAAFIPGSTVTLTEEVQTVTVTVTKNSKENGIYKLNLSKKKAAVYPKLANFIAQNFIGVFSNTTMKNVINSDLKWEPFQNAAYYNVFIDGERTNDPKDGNLTETKFRTATGIIDIDAKMGNEEKTVKIEVRAYDAGGKVIAVSGEDKILPRKNRIENIFINGEIPAENQVFSNPVTVKIELNNAIKFVENADKAAATAKQYVMITYYDEPVLSDAVYIDSENILLITPQGGLKEGSPYEFCIKKGFCDKFNMYYADADIKHSFKVKKTPDAPEPAVEKILINDEENLNIKDGEKTDIDVENSVSIYFNQLIDISTFIPSEPGETGNKGSGIYITDKANGKGFDESRLVDAQFETVKVSAEKYITKATFRMAGKAFFTSEPEPLKGNTEYWIVIEDSLKTSAGKKFTEQRFKFRTGEEKPVLYKAEVKNGIIVGNIEEPFNIKMVKAGMPVTIKAVIPDGKVFDHWHVGEYFQPPLSEEQKTSEEMTFIMIAEDVYFTAEFKE